MSLPTITGVPPETWEQILQILNQLGVTVWDLAQQGITTWEGAGGLKEYLLNNGWELKEVWDLKYMWFQTGAGDVTQSNALVQYVANRVTVAGTAGAEYVNHFTYGETTLGKLKKGIIFASIFSLLVETLQPNFITDVLKSRLDSVIDFFADENDDVPVILDGNGKIYYHEDMINALRQALIDEGVYNLSESAQKDSSTSGLSYTGVPDNAFPIPLYSADTLFYFGTGNQPSNSRFNVKSDAKAIRFNEYFSSDRVTESIIFASKTPTINIYSSYDGAPLAPDDYTIYSATFNGQTVYYCYVSKWARSDLGDLSAYENIHPAFLSASSLPTNTRATLAWLMMYNSTSAGVEGITVSDDLISRGIGNAQTALEDIFPSYATDKVTTINPSDEDITAFDNWYPISTSDSDVWTDGITEQQSETATDGEVTPDIQAQIADAIKQILEDYYRDPDDPDIINYPEIPVGDSGDTPPANPELLSGSSNGLWAIYNPSKSEVQQFGAWLWSSNILDQITRMFNSPIDAVIGFHMIYCTPITGASKTIKAGYLDSPVSAPEVTDQYKDIDCGTIAIPEYYRNALDYDNTRISLFLPFIGIVPLDTAQVMGSSLSILYRIDVLTGTCLAQVSVIKEGSNAVMYTYQGNCSVQIPLTATTYTGMVGALLSGISAGASIMTGNIMGAVSAGLEGAMRAGTGLTGVRQSGTLGANAGALGIRIPYVIITHPVSVMPDDFNTLEGLPSAELVPLSSVSGFTRVTYVHLENIPATSQEIEEITGMLQTGVIF